MRYKVGKAIVEIADSPTRMAAAVVSSGILAGLLEYVVHALVRGGYSHSGKPRSKPVSSFNSYTGQFPTKRFAGFAEGKMSVESRLHIKASASTPSAGQTTIENTRRGPIEYAVEGEGPAVLAIHGAMGGYDQGLILARTVGESGYRYIAVSRPGYLGTPLPSGRTPEEQADLYADLLDVLNIPEAAVIAVSGGGPSALHFALRHHKRCWALVLISTCGGKVDTPVPLSFKIVKLLMRSPWFVSKMSKRAERNPEQAARHSITDPVVRARTLRDPEAGPLFTALLSSTSARMAQRLPGTENDIMVTRTTDYPLEQIAVPSLVVHGTADRMVPFAMHGKPLATRIPGAELLAIEGGEHVSIFTHRNEVRARVAEFLRRHVAFSAPSCPSGSTAGGIGAGCGRR